MHFIWPYKIITVYISAVRIFKEGFKEGVGKKKTIIKIKVNTVLWTFHAFQNKIAQYWIRDKIKDDNTEFSLHSHISKFWGILHQVLSYSLLWQWNSKTVCELFVNINYSTGKCQNMRQIKWESHSVGRFLWHQYLWTIILCMFLHFSTA
jgi:hypothetical protein